MNQIPALHKFRDEAVKGFGLLAVWHPREGFVHSHDARRFPQQFAEICLPVPSSYFKGHLQDTRGRQRLTASNVTYSVDCSESAAAQYIANSILPPTDGTRHDRPELQPKFVVLRRWNTARILCCDTQRPSSYRLLRGHLHSLHFEDRRLGAMVSLTEAGRFASGFLWWEAITCQTAERNLAAGNRAAALDTSSRDALCVLDANIDLTDAADFVVWELRGRVYVICFCAPLGTSTTSRSTSRSQSGWQLSRAPRIRPGCRLKPGSPFRARKTRSQMSRSLAV
jgi:hypothetical protein